MKIHFGLYFDGMSPNPAPNAMGEKWLGPLGMLALLQAQLGIAPSQVSHTSRVIEYLKLLQEHGQPHHFFHKSLQVDEFNVAAELLSWRDQWYLSGWDGTFTDDASERLATLSQIERHTKERIHPSLGEQLQQICERLDSGQKTQIDKIVLFDELELYPMLWQGILSHFSAEQKQPLSSQASSATDLGRAQRLLLNLQNEDCKKDKDGTIIKSTLSGDGSFRVINSLSATISAKYLSQQIINSAPDESIVILSGSSGIELDEALESNNLPRLGFSQPASERPLLQLLPLALELMWAPLDPEKLLEFLLLPYSPIPQRVSRALAEVVAERPGIGGVEWQDKLKQLEERENQQGRSKQWPNIQKRISEWLECDRYPRQEGVGAEQLLSRVTAVEGWLQKQGSLFDNEYLGQLARIASSHANELAELLLQLDGRVLKPEQLDYLLEQIVGDGTGVLDRGAECDPNRPRNIFASQNPANVRAPVDHLYWWNPLPTPSARYPWSHTELEGLYQAGVTLPILDKQLKARAESWLYPILAAKKSMTLVIHKQEEGHHPVWDQITSILKGWQALQTEDLILKGGEDEQPIPFNQLPSKRRWWQIDATHLGKRDKESYSSLDQCIKSPDQWVLNHKAKIRSGGLTSINGGPRLKGLLVHTLYERFFNEHPDHLNKAKAKKKLVDSWLDKILPILLQQEGATLLQPGKMVERLRFEEQARNSLHALLDQLRAADVITVEMEAYHEAKSPAGLIGGYIDIRVINRSGKEAIIDIKWGGEKYKRTDLKENQHLQLVLYAFLRHHHLKDQEWPPVAYFIIDSGVILTHDRHYFPAANTVTPDGDESSTVVWKRFMNTWGWRRKQLDRGLIEVTVSETEPDEDSQPGEDGLVLPDNSDRYSDYGVLTGWSDEA